MKRLITVGLVLTLALSSASCGGKEGRAGEYLERAQKSFDLGDYVKAELDVKNTLQIDPNSVAAVRLMAKLAEKQEKSREHFQMLQKIVQLDPSDIDAHVKVGRVYAAAGRMEEARSHADSALAVDPNSGDARILNATIVFKEGDIEGAREIANDVLSAEPRQSSALAFLASTYQASEPDRALDLLDRAIAAESDNEGLHKVKIALLNRLGRKDAVQDELRKAIAKYPNSNEYRYSLANFLGEQGQLEPALEVLENIITANPDDTTAKLYYAQYLGNNKNAESAIDILKQYVQEEPEVQQFKFALAQAYVLTGQRGEARNVFQGVIDTDANGPSGIQARTKLASLQMLEGEEEPAKETIAGVLADEPTNAEALLMRASIDLRDGNSTSAINDLRTILRDNPTHQNARLLLGKAHAQAGESNLAMEEYRRLLDANPNNLEGRRDLAVLLVQSQRWDEVRSLLEVGLKQAPNDLKISRLLIDTYMRQQEWDLAEGLARNILTEDPDSAMGHYVIARILQARGEFGDSIPAFKKALEFAPDAIENITGLVRSYVRLDDTDEALAFLENFSAEHPDNIQALTLWGEMLARKQDWAGATRKNEAALAKNKAWLPAYRNLIGIHLRAGDLDKADGVVERGLSNAPDSADLLMMRATIFEQQGMWDKAIDLYDLLLTRNSGLDIAANNYIALVADHRADPATLDKALAIGQRFLNSDNPIFQDTLGWLMFKMGDIEQALPLLEQSVSKAGQLPQLRYHLGMAYYRLDQLENARRELEAATQNADTDYQGYAEAKATLKLL
ncbi:MAG: tetratricopeptide repeat protein [Gammaproteobacteria bacterium]